MGKPQSHSGLVNVISYDTNGNISFVSGSTTLMSVSSSKDITTTGKITATTLVVQTITSSISSITGSTQFGSSSINTHQFTGSMFITGSSTLSGSLNIAGQIISTFSGQSISIRASGTGSVRMQLQNNDIGNSGVSVESSTGGNQFTGTTGYAMAIGTYTARDFFIGTNSVQRFSVMSGGQVNVNSTQTTYPFYVQAALGNWTAVFENTTSGASGVLMRSTGGSQGYYYGAYDGGAYKFFVNGTGVVNSTSTSITIISSDIKLKTDIRDYNKGLAEVLAMKPRIYKRKDNLEVDEVGFIAQEMDIALAGSMIESYKDENGEPINTYKLEWYPLLVKAIQELKAEIDELKNNK